MLTKDPLSSETFRNIMKLWY